MPAQPTTKSRRKPSAKTAPTATVASAERGPSVNATVYEAIKELITGGSLRAGVKLIHQDLASKLNVSRTPVREALERLYQEGFATRLPRRGFYVAEIDHDEARELYELREALEIYALRRAMARNIKASELRKLDSFNQRYSELLHNDTMRERMMVDRDWHLALAALADNRAISRSLEAVFERLILKIRTDGWRMVRGEEALREHRSMMKALRAEDAALAEQLLADHIRGARRRLVGHLSEMTR